MGLGIIRECFRNQLRFSIPKSDEDGTLQKTRCLFELEAAENFSRHCVFYDECAFRNLFETAPKVTHFLDREPLKTAEEGVRARMKFLFDLTQDQLFLVRDRIFLLPPRLCLFHCQSH